MSPSLVSAAASSTTLVNGVLDGGEEEFLLDDESTISEQERHERARGAPADGGVELDDLAEDLGRPLSSLLSSEYMESRDARDSMHFQVKLASFPFWVRICCLNYN